MPRPRNPLPEMSISADWEVVFCDEDGRQESYVIGTTSHSERAVREPQNEEFLRELNKGTFVLRAQEYELRWIETAAQKEALLSRFFTH